MVVLGYRRTARTLAGLDQIGLLEVALVAYLLGDDRDLLCESLGGCEGVVSAFSWP